MATRSLVGLLIVALLEYHVEAYPTGADPRACVSMYPQHGRHQARSSESPFEVVVSSNSYNFLDHEAKITVTIKGLQTFKGFLLQARSADWSKNPNDIFGTFSVPAGTKLTCQNSPGDAVTHTGSHTKASKTFVWKPKSKNSEINPGHIKFVATFVQEYNVFWVQVTSNRVSEANTPNIPDPQPVYKGGSNTGEVGGSAAVAVMSPKGCGETKGCLRMPEGCGETEGCRYFLSWVPDGNSVSFTLSGVESGYVAMGLSEDRRMGDDNVIACVRDKRYNKPPKVVYGTNEGKSFKLAGNVAYEGGSFVNNRITCTFTLSGKDGMSNEVGSLFEERHILLAAGDTDDGEIQMHTLQSTGFPTSSKDPVSFNEKKDYDTSNRYPLVKAHGILMLLAWVLCASVAIILARYYKPMWPNTSVGGTRVWYQVHRGLQLCNLVLTCIAFILIFVHVGGYSKMSGLPAKAHPILGIIVFILVIVNPIMAIFRCSPDAKYRPCFNWFHWAVGTIAHILSIPTIFIGMNLGKSNTPWWATWILFIWCIVHLVTEIVLEIHGCCMARKNKRKYEDWEMKRLDFPESEVYRKEVEPKGRGCKCCMLWFYLVVTIIAVIVLLLVIAIN